MSESDGYVHDFFISYCMSSQEVAYWTQTRLFPKLQNRWADSIIEPAKFYVANSAQESSDWQVQNTEALHRSKVLIAILSASYLNSPYCMAEWNAFAEREQVCGMDARTPLILPILFAGGTQVIDMVQPRLVNCSFRPLVRQNTSTKAFTDAIDLTIAKLFHMRQYVPNYRSGWSQSTPNVFSNMTVRQLVQGVPSLA